MLDSNYKRFEVFSEGMICSEEELGFSEESEGIWELDDSFVVGEDFGLILKRIFKSNYQSPNRPDWLGLRGILRELYVKNGISYTLPSTNLIPKNLSDYKIEIHDTAGCPYIWRIDSRR